MLNHSALGEGRLEIIENGLKTLLIEFVGCLRGSLNKMSLPIHSLLHCADYIRQAGPLRQHWSFGMERLCKLAKTMSVATQKPSVALSNKACLRFLAQLTGCIAEVIDDCGDEQARDEEIEFNSHGLDGEQVEKLVLSVREPAYDLFYQFNTETTKCFRKICTNHGIFKPRAFRP